MPRCEWTLEYCPGEPVGAIRDFALCAEHITAYERYWGKQTPESIDDYLVRFRTVDDYIVYKTELALKLAKGPPKLVVF
jgi:hypothetical protein